TVCAESSGAWYCPVPVADTTLTIQFAKDGYVTSTANAFASDRTAATDAQVTNAVTGIQYGFKVTSAANALGTALTGATVDAGDSYGTSCTEATGVWYCAIPLANTGLAIRLTKDGYVTNTGNSFAS